MKNILITGATGFIGKHLVEELLKKDQKYMIYALSRKPVKIKGVKVIKGDITKKQSLKLPENIDTVFHLAALTNSDKKGEEAYREFKEINFYGTLNLAEACSKLKHLKKFIFFSSVDALGIVQGKVLDEKSDSDAKSPYDISKYYAEKYLIGKFKKEKFPVVILRPTMVYGEGELSSAMKVNVAIFKICKMVKKHAFPIIGNGKNLLPLVHVSNIVKGAILAEKNGKKGEIYILSDERSYPLNELVSTIAEIQNIRFPGIHVPKFFIKTTAGVFEIFESFTGFRAPIKKSAVDYITQNRMFSIAKAKKELKYMPINLKQGMEKTIKWFREKGYL